MRRNVALVGVSQFVADPADSIGYEAGCVQRVLNGLEQVRWQRPVRAVDLDSEFGAAPYVPLIDRIGRLVPWRGHEQLIRALVGAEAQGAEFPLLIVGAADPRPAICSPCWETLRRARVADARRAMVWEQGPAVRMARDMGALDDHVVEARRRACSSTAGSVTP